MFATKMKEINIFHGIFVFILLLICNVSAISRTNSSLLNNNQLNQLKYSPQTVEPRGQEQWGYLDGYGHDMGAYGKSEYYWLIPLVIVIGFGALLLPLLGTLMTTMITQGTINLTAGRRKRDIHYNESNKGISEHIIGLLAKIDDSLEKFGKQIKNDVSPLVSALKHK